MKKIYIPRDTGKLPTDKVEPQQCGNCGTWRQVHDWEVEQCPLCGDEAYNLAELEEQI